MLDAVFGEPIMGVQWWKTVLDIIAIYRPGGGYVLLVLDGEITFGHDFNPSPKDKAFLLNMGLAYHERDKYFYIRV